MEEVEVITLMEVVPVEEIGVREVLVVMRMDIIPVLLEVNRAKRLIALILT